MVLARATYQARPDYFALEGGEEIKGREAETKSSKEALYLQKPLLMK